VPSAGLVPLSMSGVSHEFPYPSLYGYADEVDHTMLPGFSVDDHSPTSGSCHPPLGLCRTLKKPSRGRPQKRPYTSLDMCQTSQSSGGVGWTTSDLRQEAWVV
jgi:hypothetical protein